MESSPFHFADTRWLWGLSVIPVMLAAYALLHRPGYARARLEKFADKHLLPHLVTRRDAGTSARSSLLLWSVIWGLGTLAMAGPRWNYTDVQTYQPERNLVILLSLAQSMDAQDVKPSRMAQAREQIEDLLHRQKGLNIGLIGYAADAHMISPLTDDTRSIQDLLPYLDTSLPAVQGDTLKPALDMAAHMLAAEQGDNKSILVLSDGDFQDVVVSSAVDAGIAVYALGIGTRQGAPVPGAEGLLKNEDGSLVISRLQEEKLQALSASHNGFYAQADYTDDGVRRMLSRIYARDRSQGATGRTVRSWEEHFYLLAALMAALMLPWFRKGAVFPLLAFCTAFVLPPAKASAGDWHDLFLNKAQQAAEFYRKGDYKDAALAFDTPYRRGVAQYKAGDFVQAEQSFTHDDTAPSARYNQGNAQTMQGKYDDAIASYEAVLKRQPDNAKARHNLEIARKLKALQQQQDKQKQPDKNKHSGDSPNKDPSDKNKEQKQPEAGNQNKDKNEAKDQSKPTPDPAAAEKKDQQKNQQAAAQPATKQNDGKQSAAPADVPENSQAADARPRTPKDVDADQWLNRIENDPQTFLKNQFRIETEANGTAQGDQP